VLQERLISNYNVQTGTLFADGKKFDSRFVLVSTTAGVPANHCLTVMTVVIRSH